MIKEQIRQELSHVITTLAKKGALKSSPERLGDAHITKPKDKSHGDYASNCALVLAKEEGSTPRDVANLIVPLLQTSKLFSEVDIAGPGFINFTLSDECLSQIVPTIAKASDNYGRTKLAQKKRALIEFVSANPTGGLHLGHARGAFVGDALARLLDAAGYEVTKEFYVNDVGNQIETLARTIHKRYRELFGETIVIEKGEYPGEYVKDIAQALKDFYKDRFLDKPESEWLDIIGRFGVDYNLALIKRSLHAAGIEMDEWYHERTLHENPKRDELLALYAARNMLYEAQAADGTQDKVRREESKAAKFSHLQEGGTFLKTSLFGDDEDRIVQRKDGRFVYLTADLAYHHEKYARGYDLLVDVFGADHAGHIGRIKAGMAALGHDADKMHFVMVQMMRLLKGGVEVRFSKRAGEVVGLDDLIAEVGKDVARFVFLMRSTNSQFDLDLDAVKKQSSDNPVFYVQYGHARMATILHKASNEAGLVLDPEHFSIAEQKTLILPEERELLLRISELDEVVREAAAALEPHRLIFYCQELIKTFHSYFTKYRHSEKIISDDMVKTKSRLALVYAIKQTIYNALQFLGLSAPEHMELTAESEHG